MMNELQNHLINCPYCGEVFEALIDVSEGDSEYTEDCYVCCRPIIFSCHIANDGSITVSTRTENETL